MLLSVHGNRCYSLYMETDATPCTWELMLLCEEVTDHSSYFETVHLM